MQALCPMLALLASYFWIRGAIVGKINVNIMTLRFDPPPLASCNI